jgi:threonine/homoserine/homoserine lactone efflux protein
MPPASSLLAFVGASLALLLVPGPSVLFVVSRGVALGRRAAVTTVFGNTSGSAVHVLAVALGVGAIVQRSVIVFNALKLAGAAYLVYLGVSALVHRRSLAELVGGATAATSRRLWRDGFIVGVTNPKTTLFFLAILPQFADPARGHLSAQLLALGVIYCVIATITDSCYGMAAGTLRRWLDGRPRRAEAVGVTSGLVMLTLGVRLALTGRRD